MHAAELGGMYGSYSVTKGVVNRITELQAAVRPNPFARAARRPAVH